MEEKVGWAQKDINCDGQFVVGSPVFWRTFLWRVVLLAPLCALVRAVASR